MYFFKQHSILFTFVVIAFTLLLCILSAIFILSNSLSKHLDFSSTITPPKTRILCLGIIERIKNCLVELLNSNVDVINKNKQKKKNEKYPLT